MPLFLITGTAGTGKSEVCRWLKEKGYEAYDIDEDGLAKWQHNETRYIHPKSSVKKEDRTPEFLKNHSWNVLRQDLEQLARHVKSKPVFICGALGNEEKLNDLFGSVFALYVDDETLKYRLATRTGNDWGKQPHELQLTLDTHHHVYDKYRNTGAIVVDATQSVEDVVKDILLDIKA